MVWRASAFPVGVLLETCVKSRCAEAMRWSLVASSHPAATRQTARAEQHSSAPCLTSSYDDSSNARANNTRARADVFSRAGGGGRRTEGERAGERMCAEAAAIMARMGEGGRRPPPSWPPGLQRHCAAVILRAIKRWCADQTLCLAFLSGCRPCRKNWRPAASAFKQPRRACL